jgi:hypothetical protein
VNGSSREHQSSTDTCGSWEIKRFLWLSTSDWPNLHDYHDGWIHRQMRPLSSEYSPMWHYFIVWKRPRKGWIKFNCDGAHNDSLDLAGCGGIFENQMADGLKDTHAK